MATTKYSGMKTYVCSSARGTLTPSGVLTANQWVEIASVGETGVSTLPLEMQEQFSELPIPGKHLSHLQQATLHTL